jgi:hypothetical protein
MQETQRFFRLFSQFSAPLRLCVNLFRSAEIRDWRLEIGFEVEVHWPFTVSDSLYAG